jgi:hypothetical protein
LEVIVGDHFGSGVDGETTWPSEVQSPTWLNAAMLFVWLAAGIVAFLPFALDTSPWDAVTLRVPGNQGNWWHLLVGAPFFLAFPMIWLRLRSLFAKQSSTAGERRLIRMIWIAVGLSIVSTLSVETPFLLHLAGTSEWQRLSILSLGLGIIVVSAILLFLRSRYITPSQARLIGLDTAYLANTALSLVVYSSAAGSTWSKSGWLVSMVIVWPIAFEVIWIFSRAFRVQRSQLHSRVA